MAEKSLHHRFMFMPSLFFILYVFQAILATDHTSFSSKHSQSLSHDDGDDFYALFQFKQSSYYYFPDCEKIASWKLNNGFGTGKSDYSYLWDGVDCDDKGHVVSIDLSNSRLYSPISSTTNAESERMRVVNCERRPISGGIEESMKSL